MIERVDVLLADGQVHEAQAAFLAALEFDDSLVVRNEYGCFLTRIGNNSEAKNVFAALLSDARRSNDAVAREAAANNLGVVCRSLGEYLTASSMQQQSIAAAAEGSNDTGVSTCDLANLANDAICRGDLEFAEELLRRSMAQEIANQSLDGLASDLGSLGVVACLRGETSRSLACLWWAFRLHRSLKDHRNAGIDLLNLAEVCRKAGRWKSGLRFALRAADYIDRASAADLATKAQRIVEELGRIADVAQRDPLLN